MLTPMTHMQRFYRNFFHYGPRTLPVLILLLTPILAFLQYSLVFSIIYGGAWFTLLVVWVAALFGA